MWKDDVDGKEKNNENMGCWILKKSSSCEYSLPSYPDKKG